MGLIVRPGRWRCVAALAVAAIALVLPAASGAATGPTPFVDCVASTNGTFIAYFGYVDPSSASNIAVGVNNSVVPGISFQGQPSYFETGTYLRAFSVAFGTVFTEVAWDLNGVEAVATESSPACDDAVSAAASALAPTTATLNGVVTPNGEPTTYTFSWGTSTAYTQQSQPVMVTGNAPQLVSDQINGLQPGTTYHFVLQASNIDDGASTGTDETFTTPIAAAPSVDLSLTNTASALTITAGQGVTYTVTATNTSTTTPATGVTITDALPGGLSFTGATSSQGACSGSATVVCALGQLAPGAAATVTIAGTAQGAEPLVDTASVFGDQPDPDTANDTASVTATVVATPAATTGTGTTPTGTGTTPTGTGTTPTGAGTTPTGTGTTPTGTTPGTTTKTTGNATRALKLIGSPSGRGGHVRVTIGCVGTTGLCNLLATLSTREIRASGHVQAVTAAATRARSVLVAVGSDRAQLAAGRRVTLTIALNAAGRILLERFGRLPVNLQLALTGAGAHAAKVTTVIVKAPSGRAG